MKRTPLTRKTPLRAKTVMLSKPSKHKARRPVTVKAYHDRVRELGCVITGRPNPTLHHVHGGSMRGLVTKGGKLKTSDWLVIPLAIELHSLDPEGIDAAMGVQSWERKYGTQLWWLAHVAEALQVDVFSLAGIERPNHITKYPEEP